MNTVNLKHAAGLFALAAATMSGCTISVPVIGATAGPALYYTSTAFPQGPRAQFVNDSLIPMNVRYWVGRRDISAQGGVADIRTGDDLAFTAEPGDLFITQLGREFSPVSNADSVVWVRVDVGEPGAVEPIWFQLEHPAPYTLRATGDSVADLVFERAGEAGITPLPRDRWIASNNGPFPAGAR
jgi:hypothetical protein